MIFHSRQPLRILLDFLDSSAYEFPFKFLNRERGTLRVKCLAPDYDARDLPLLICNQVFTLKSHLVSAHFYPCLFFFLQNSVWLLLMQPMINSMRCDK